jgi:hypothetical protein
VGDPRDAAPFTATSVHGHRVSWLLQADNAALAVVNAGSAAAVWQAIDDRNRPHRISCVGIESIDRYLLTERAARRHTTLL